MSVIHFYFAEFSFLAKYYSLLYQSFIPNCSLTITTLRYHCSIPRNVENYILNENNRRKRCQRLLDFLLVQLDSHRDYMQFCYYLTLVSVITNLPFRLIAGKVLSMLLHACTCVRTN